MFATPIAYLINEQGVIARDVAVGTDAIVDLLATLDGSAECANKLEAFA